MISAVLLFGIAFILVALALPILAPIAVRAGYVDAPGGRKQHDRAVAPIGGVVIVPVALAVHGLSGADVAHYWPLYVGLIVLTVMGALDDCWQLRAGIRFVLQLLVASIVVLFGACRIDGLGDLFGLGVFELGFMAIPFSIAAVALLVNAINLMDGLDGLAGGQSFLVLAMLWGLAWFYGYAPYITGLAPFVGAVLGFLLHNMRSPVCKKARVFLGDAGTLSLGLMLAWFTIAAATKVPEMRLEPICVAWLLAVPIMDECAQFYRRVREGRHPFSADRGHFHHHFMDAGFSVGVATASILSFSTVLGAGAYLCAQAGVPLVVLTVIWIAALLAHMYVTAHRKGAYARLFARFKPS